MLDVQQVFPTGNPRKPYCWNSSSRGKSQECVQPAAGSSGELHKYQWREWMQDSSKHYERKSKGPHRGQRRASELERYYLIPLASWCQAYWRNKIATEDGRVPLPGRQI